MSGLLRRIKRSRTADAGETAPEGQAAAPEGAPPTAELPAGVAAPATADAAVPPEPPADPLRAIPPGTPAGLDPAEAPTRPPAGRRGRLRRRLRYLRRARELMLRDLGGLLYEIHRTGGGNVDAHATVLGAKVQRLAGLDAEAHALEAALGAARGEAVVFQPGVGGTCAACGELYGSGALFCSRCGTPTGAVAEVPPPAAPATAAPVPAMPPAPEQPAETSAPPAEPEAEEPTRALPPSPGAPQERTHPEPEPEPADGFARNGRDGEPDRSAGDPLVSKESRS